MKFNNEASEAQLTGDVQTNKVSIDTSNIDFIITILSTNLYSNPIQSFVRETVSNAWDSHVEAGVTKPVIIEIGTNSEDKHYCKVQDFGTGISPERFQSIYRNIGSSTKRDDNTQIGGYGIGRFSALAYSDMVQITSIYDGIEYMYLMYKDGNSISIDLMHSMKTDNPNGVSVSLEIKPGDVLAFKDAIIKQLCYFENLYFDITNYRNLPVEHYSQQHSENLQINSKRFNSLKIKRYNNFAVKTETTYEMSLLLGKVQYPLRINSLTIDVTRNIERYPISLTFDIGELSVTPNREEVLYNDVNIKAIENKLAAAVNEIKDLAALVSSQDYIKMPDYVNAISEELEVVLLEDENNSVSVYVGNKSAKATFNGVSYNNNDFINIYNTVLDHIGLHYTTEILDGKITRATAYNNTGSITIHQIRSKFKDFYVARIGELSVVTKQYVRENFSNGSKIMPPIGDKALARTIRSYRKYVVKMSTEYAHKPFTYNYTIFKMIAKYFINNLSKMKVLNDNSVPQAYIDKKKAEALLRRGNVSKNLVDWKQNLNFYPLRVSNRGVNDVVTDTQLKSLEDLKGAYKKLVVYSDKDNSPQMRLMYNLYTESTEVVFVEIAPTKMKLLEHLPNFVKFDTLMKSPNFRILRDLGTAYLIQKTYPELRDLNNLKNINLISDKLSDILEILSKFVNKHLKAYRTQDKQTTAMLEEVLAVCEQKNHFNFEMLGLMKANKKLLDNSRFILNFKSTLCYESVVATNQIPYMVDYIMSRKLFIPNRETLKQLRENQKTKIEDNENSQS